MNLKIEGIAEKTCKTRRDGWGGNVNPYFDSQSAQHFSFMVL